MARRSAGIPVIKIITMLGKAVSKSRAESKKRERRNEAERVREWKRLEADKKRDAKEARSALNNSQRKQEIKRIIAYEDRCKQRRALCNAYIDKEVR